MVKFVGPDRRHGFGWAFDQERPLHALCNCGWRSALCEDTGIAAERWHEHKLEVAAAENGEDQVGSGHQDHPLGEKLDRLAWAMQEIKEVLERLVLAAENATPSRPYPNYRL